MSERLDMLKRFAYGGASAQRAVNRVLRTRRVALRSVSETEIQAAVCTYWAMQWPKLWRVTFHVPNGIAAASRTQVARLVGLGFKAGVSDLVCLSPRGSYTCLVLELKRLGQKPTRPQAEFLEAVEAMGGCGRWADSFDDARAVIDGYASLGSGETLTALAR